MIENVKGFWKVDRIALIRSPFSFILMSQVVHSVRFSIKITNSTWKVVIHDISNFLVTYNSFIFFQLALWS